MVDPQSVTSVLVSNANAPAAAPLVVGGYDVTGVVRSDGEPMKEVTFLLYSASVHQEVSPPTPPPPHPPTPPPRCQRRRHRGGVEGPAR